jgi:hypothetical protein
MPEARLPVKAWKYKRRGKRDSEDRENAGNRNRLTENLILAVKKK